MILCEPHHYASVPTFSICRSSLALGILPCIPASLIVLGAFIYPEIFVHYQIIAALFINDSQFFRDFWKVTKFKCCNFYSRYLIWCFFECSEGQWQSLLSANAKKINLKLPLDWSQIRMTTYDNSHLVMSLCCWSYIYLHTDLICILLELEGFKSCFRVGMDNVRRFFICIDQKFTYASPNAFIVQLNFKKSFVTKPCSQIKYM